MKYKKRNKKNRKNKKKVNLDNMFRISPPPCPSTPEGEARKRLPEPFEVEYHPRLYSAGYQRLPRATACPSPRTPKTHRSAAPSSTPKDLYRRIKGTQKDIEELKLDKKGERYLESKISPYRGTIEVVHDTPHAGLKGLLKTPATTSTSGRGKRILLKRKVTKITIPREKRSRESQGKPLPTTYIYDADHPLHRVEKGKLLPPRRYTPSPDVPYHKRPYLPRTPLQLVNRLRLESLEEKNQDCVPSREPQEKLEMRFDSLDREMHVMPLKYHMLKRKKVRYMT